MIRYVKIALGVSLGSALAIGIVYGVMWTTPHPQPTSLMQTARIVGLCSLAGTFIAALSALIGGFDRAVPPGSDRRTLIRATWRTGIGFVFLGAFTSVVASLCVPDFSWRETARRLAEAAPCGVFAVLLLASGRAHQLRKLRGFEIPPGETMLLASFVRAQAGLRRLGSAALMLTDAHLRIRVLDSPRHLEEVAIANLRAMDITASRSNQLRFETDQGRWSIWVSNADAWAKALREACDNLAPIKRR